MLERSKVHSYISGRTCQDQIEGLKNFAVDEYKSLKKLGVLDEASISRLMRGKQQLMAMDAIQPTVTTASLGTPVQFLQNWLQGFVTVMTGARNIDEFIGIQITGSWEDEQVVQPILERIGTASLYGDYTNVPLSSWNVNNNYATVVRFEEGLRVGVLEAARAARQQVDDSGWKRKSMALQLDIQRNTIGFSGFNSGANNTYGFLNAVGLPAYVEVEEGASTSTSWADKTFLEITEDIRTGIVALRTNSQDTIDPSRVDITLAVATNSVDYLSKTSEFGLSVTAWMAQAYPRIRVVSAPQLNNANAGDNVFYMYADRITGDDDTDGGQIFIQPVPTKFMVLGVQQGAKYYEEDYSNATAGVMCKRPYAVVRYFGI